MSRQSSMSVIHEALKPKPETEPEGQPKDEVQLVPGVDNPDRPSLSPDDEEGAQDQATDDEEGAKSERQKELDAALAERQRKKDVFEQHSNATVNTAQKVLTGTSVTLEKVPQPGSVMLPLLILGVFFFLLIPVNGHTRFVWLWLTLTGNAEIDGSPSDLNGAQEVTGPPPPIISPGQSTAITAQSQSGIDQVISNIGNIASTVGNVWTGVQDVTGI